MTKTQVNGVGTYAPGPYTAGTVYSQFTIVFFDAGGNKRYTSTDLSDGTLSLVLTDGYDSEHAVSHVALAQRTVRALWKGMGLRL